MGNETSRLKGLEINEKAIEITDFWGHYRAKVLDSAAFFNLQSYGSISVFKSESIVPGLLWANQSPLEKCATSLMKYRHPCIMRYILHWQNRGVSYLATEPVRPLSQVLSTQDSLQICVGLHQILQALDFLHNKAFQSHNNVSVSSIFVMPDGCWKLGGMELLKPFAEMNPSYLKQIKNYRYDKAMDEKEEFSDNFNKIDQFAFCALVEDVFKGRTDDNLPHLKEFKEYCKKELQNPIASQRIPFSTLLHHVFFNHDFLAIHKFLTSLPVKSENEKKNFFTGLLDKLRNFSEETVAVQLGCLLLSRLVLLNSTAREQLLPYLLIPKDNNPVSSTDSSNSGLFTLTVFKHHVAPQLLKMFRVRDTQVRMLLLKHFSCYVHTFSEEDLTGHILPELLLGIKDTDDTLVSMTLYCLADLIPILGASTVIGPKRSKIFTDGRPMMNSKFDNSVGSFKRKSAKPNVKVIPSLSDVPILIESQKHSDPSSSSSNINNKKGSQNIFDSKESIEIEVNPCIHERPSPDGGEDLDSEVIKNSIVSEINASEDDWSDWEQEEINVEDKNNDISADDISNFEEKDIKNSNADKIDSPKIKGNIVSKNLYYDSKLSHKDPTFLQKAAIDAKSKKLTDISELDIKNQKNTFTDMSKSKKEEFDFFTDMEPVIQKANVLAINSGSINMIDTMLEISSNQNEPKISAKLNFTPLEIDQTDINNSAWDDVNWDGD